MNYNKITYFLFYDNALWNCQQHPQSAKIIVKEQHSKIQNANALNTERLGVQIPALILSLILLIFKMIFSSLYDFYISTYFKKALNEHESFSYFSI